MKHSVFMGPWGTRTMWERCENDVRTWFLQIPVLHCLQCHAVVIQEDYEVTPDEKRKIRGEKIIKTFLSKQVGPFVCFSKYRRYSCNIRGSYPKQREEECGRWVRSMCLLVSTQSPQHVDIAEVFADQCRENLERSPCKDIFSNCRKWGAAHSHLSQQLFYSANLACCCPSVCLTQGRPRVPECGSVCRLPKQHVLWPVPAVEGAREV